MRISLMRSRCGLNCLRQVSLDLATFIGCGGFFSRGWWGWRFSLVGWIPMLFAVVGCQPRERKVTTLFINPRTYHILVWRWDNWNNCHKRYNSKLQITICNTGAKIDAWRLSRIRGPEQYLEQHIIEGEVLWVARPPNLCSYMALFFGDQVVTMTLFVKLIEAVKNSIIIDEVLSSR